MGQDDKGEEFAYGYSLHLHADIARMRGKNTSLSPEQTVISEVVTSASSCPSAHPSRPTLDIIVRLEYLALTEQ
jgi:hypothetical protein